MQINCAQSGGASPGYVGCGLQDVELCSQSSGEIAFGDFESAICGLDISCLSFEHASSLFEIEKCTAHFRGYTAPCCCQGLHGRLAPGPRCLHPSFGSKSVEDIPSRVYSHD